MSAVRHEKLKRYGLRIVTTLVVLTFALPLGFAGWVLGGVIANPVPDFEARKGELVSSRLSSTRPMVDSVLTEITLTSSSGLQVELALRVPHAPLPGRPLLVMMGGQETGRAAVEVIAQTHGVAVAAISYPFATIPYRDGLALTLALRQIQRGILDTPPSVMLALDYLLQRPDLAPERIELAGISFGAFLAAVPGTLDSRFERVWLIHGAGDPAAVIDQGLENRIEWPPLRALVARFLAAAAGAHYLRPEDWVGRVAPRPVIVVNASDDHAVPESAVTALHLALQEPYEILWTEGDHVHPKRPQVVRDIVELIFAKMRAPLTKKYRCSRLPSTSRPDCAQT